MNAQSVPAMGHEINLILIVNQVFIRFFFQTLISHGNKMARQWVQMTRGSGTSRPKNDMYQIRQANYGSPPEST